jgi:hypothetical protein
MDPDQVLNTLSQGITEVAHRGRTGEDLERDADLVHLKDPDLTEQLFKRSWLAKVERLARKHQKKLSIVQKSRDVKEIFKILKTAPDHFRVLLETKYRWLMRGTLMTPEIIKQMTDLPLIAPKRNP